MATQKPQLSIVIPALNEERVIVRSLTRLHRYLVQNELLATTEVIVVAAGRADQTANLARAQARDFAWFQVLTPPRKVGKGRDVKLGVLAARGQQIIFMDADLATPLHHLTTAQALLGQGNDVVIGVRNLWVIHKGLGRKIASVVANWLVRIFLLPRMPDSQCGFKGFTREAAREIFSTLTIDGWGFDMELLVIADAHRYRTAIIRVDDWEDPRPEGGLVGESTWRASIRTLRELFHIRRQRAAGMYRRSA